MLSMNCQSGLYRANFSFKTLMSLNFSHLKISRFPISSNKCDFVCIFHNLYSVELYFSTLDSIFQGIDTPFSQCPALSVLNGQVGYLQTRAETCCASGTTAILTCSPNHNPIGSTSSYCSGTVWSPALG
jgi:hypothetical protein